MRYFLLLYNCFGKKKTLPLIIGRLTLVFLFGMMSLFPDVSRFSFVTGVLLALYMAEWGMYAGGVRHDDLGTYGVY
jgi:hypothetical protein